MSTKVVERTRCEACLWWEEAEIGGRNEGHCPYRAAATQSNEAWKAITLGRCSHYLAIPPTAPGPT